MPYHQTKMVTINYSYWYYFVFFQTKPLGTKQLKNLPIIGLHIPI